MKNIAGKTNTTRIASLDIAKGISILLVVIGHTILYKSDAVHLSAAFSTIRIPFFFYISGFFFSTNKKFLNYSLYKFDALVKPFIFTVLVVLTAKLITAGPSPELYQRALNMFYGTGDLIGWPWTPMWFLPHLWVVFVFSCAILKLVNYDNQKLPLKVIFLSTLLFLGSNFVALFWNLKVSLLGFNTTLQGLPFSVDIVLISSFYFILGYSTKRFVREFKPNYILFALGCLIIYMSAFYFGARIDLNYRIYNHPIFSILSSLAGIYCVLTISDFISKYGFIDKILLPMGRYSLFILIFHGVVHNIIAVSIARPMTNWETTLAFLAAIIFPVIIGKLISGSDFLSLFYVPLKTNKLLHRTGQLATE